MSWFALMWEHSTAYNFRSICIINNTRSSKKRKMPYLTYIISHTLSHPVFKAATPGNGVLKIRPSHSSIPSLLLPPLYPNLYRSRPLRIICTNPSLPQYNISLLFSTLCSSFCRHKSKHSKVKKTQSMNLPPIHP